jgi:hypothetical protein
VPRYSTVLSPPMSASEPPSARDRWPERSAGKPGSAQPPLAGAGCRGKKFGAQQATLGPIFHRLLGVCHTTDIGDHLDLAAIAVTAGSALRRLFGQARLPASCWLCARPTGQDRDRSSTCRSVQIRGIPSGIIARSIARLTAAGTPTARQDGSMRGRPTAPFPGQITWRSGGRYQRE